MFTINKLKMSFVINLLLKIRSILSFKYRKTSDGT